MKKTPCCKMSPHLQEARWQQAVVSAETTLSPTCTCPWFDLVCSCEVDDNYLKNGKNGSNQEPINWTLDFQSKPTGWGFNTLSVQLLAGGHRGVWILQHHTAVFVFAEHEGIGAILYLTIPSDNMEAGKGDQRVIVKEIYFFMWFVLFSSNV